MTADKRNTAVVVALIVSLTVGIRVLTWLEPERPCWEGAPLLMAEQGGFVDEVVVTYTPSREALRSVVVDERDSLCVVYPDEEPYWSPSGPVVQLVVVGSATEALDHWQKEKLLAVLGSLDQASGGRDLVPVRLAPELRQAELLPQAADLCKLLARKRIISDF